MIGAEGLAAAVAMELVTTGAKELAAGGVGTGPNFEEGATVAIFVIFNWQALEQRVAGGAGGGSKSSSHVIDGICLTTGCQAYKPI